MYKLHKWHYVKSYLFIYKIVTFLALKTGVFIDEINFWGVKFRYSPFNFSFFIELDKTYKLDGFGDTYLKVKVDKVNK